MEGGQTLVQIALVGLRAGDKGRGGVSSLLQESTNEWVEGGFEGREVRGVGGGGGVRYHTCIPDKECTLARQ